MTGVNSWFFKCQEVMKDDPQSKEGGTIVGSYSLLSFFHFEVGVYLCLFFVAISLYAVVKFLCYCLSNCDLFE